MSLSDESVRSTDTTAAPDQGVVFAALDAAANLEGNAVDATGVIETEQERVDTLLLARNAAKNRTRLLRFGILAVVVIIGLGFILFRHGQTQKPLDSNKLDASQRYSNTSVPLGNVSGGGAVALENTPTLSVNGQLHVSDSLVLTPGAQPTDAIAGQLYYDQTTNRLSYFDGKAFVSVLSGQSNNIVQSIGGQSGNIAVGQGMVVTNNVLSNTGVLTLQGQSGNVILASGGGIAISGTTVSNTGVLSVAGQTGDIGIGNGLRVVGSQLQNSGLISATAGNNIAITSDGNGNIIISATGGVGTGVTSPGGTTGKLAVFTSTQTIADSLLSEGGGTVSVAGNLDVSGSLTLASPLSVAQGGTGSGNLTANGLLIGNGSGAITAISGATGQCLIATAGAPTFQTCPGGGGVTSLNGLSGVVAIANSTALGSTITINSAKADGSTKGIATFNATNFSDNGSGVINTVQNINTGATPTFASINLTTALSIANGGTGTTTAGGARINLGAAASGANSDITSLSGLTTALNIIQGGTGATTLALNGVLIGNGTSAISSLTAGSAGLCLTSTAGTPTWQNCPGSGGVTTSGSHTQNFVTKFDATTNAITNSSIFDNGSGVSIGGTSPVGLFNVGNTNQFQISATGGVKAVGIDSGTGLLQGSGGLSVTGGVTFSSLVGSPGQCLSTDGSGNLVLIGCLTGSGGGSGGVASLNGLSGTLNIANASALGSTITINNGAANGTTKGIVAFNATNFSDNGSGVINTVQNINTTATPTFGGLTLTTALPVTSGGTGGTSAAGARTSLGAAASGANSDITSLSALTTALSVSQGGTGLSALTANQLLFANSTSTIGQLPNGTSGQCLISNGAGSSPSFQTCTGAGGVASIDGQSGTVLLANSSGASGTITIDNAKADGTTRGIAAFNSTDFSASGGVIDTIQGIATSSTPTFAGLTLGTALSVSNGGTGTISFTNTNGAVYYDGSKLVTTNAGTTGQCLLAATGSAPSFGTCTGAGGVSSIDSLVGVLALANSTGTGTTITINNAKADGTTKGIAAFNATNFSDNGGGLINTIQDINSTANPTFATINATTGFKLGSTSGSSTACSSGQFLQNQVVAGGIVTGGTCATPSAGVGTVGTIDGGIYSANGASISGSTIYLQTASNTQVGLINTSTQNFGGNKQFIGNTTLGANDFSNGTTVQGQLSITGGGPVTTSLIVNAGNITNSATASLIQIGSAIAGGNSTSNGGTYLGLNAPSTGPGSAADFLNFEHNGSSMFNIDASGNTSIQGNTNVGGILNATSGYRFNGTSGSSTTCTSGNVLQNAVIQGGIITSGTCVANGGGFAPTLQNVYDNSGTANPQIQLSATNGGLKLRDASSTVGNIFQIQDSTGANTYFAVTNSGISTTNGTFNGNLAVASSATTGTAANITANSLTSGNGLNVSTTSANNTSGNTMNINDTATVTTPQSQNGSELNINRSLTANISTTPSITLDATSSATLASTATSKTWSHTVGTGVNRYLVVSASVTCTTGCITGVTYNGKPLTRQVTVTRGGTSDIWTMKNPDSGTHNIVATFNTLSYGVFGASSWTNVDQTTPIDSTATFNAASGVVTGSVSSSTTDMVIDNVYSAYPATLAAQAGQTQIITANSGSSVMVGATSYKAGVGASTTMAESSGSDPSAWAYTLISLKRSAGTLQVSGAVANFQSSCTVTTGNCNDLSSILNLNQQYAGATGAVATLQNAGSGDMIDLVSGSGTIVAKFDASGNLTANSVNSVTGYSFNGSAGATTTCTSGNVLQNAIVQGGIVTGGTCVANGAGVTLQNAYDNSAATNPQIQLTSGSGGLKLRDASSTVGNIFQIQNSTGATTYLAVTNAGASVTGSLSASTAVSTPAIRPITDGTQAIKIQNVAGTANILTIDTSNGRVGINTGGAPTSALQIMGTTNITTNSSSALSIINPVGGGTEFSVDTVNHQVNISATANANVGTPAINSDALQLQGSYWNGAAVVNKQTGIQEIISASAPIARLAFTNTAGTETATLTDGGFLGLGNANPQYTLDVTGNANITSKATINDVQTNFIDNNGATLTINNSANTGGQVALTVNGGITLQGVNSANRAPFTSPGGFSTYAAISAAGLSLGVGQSGILIGLTNTTSTTASGIEIFDARTGVHDPTIEVASPNESQGFGLSWDGSNTLALLKTSSNSVALQANGINALTASNNSGVGLVNVSGGFQSGSASQFQIDTSGNISTTGTSLVKTTSATAFQIQNASSAVLFTADTSTGTITFGTGSNTVIFTAGGGLVASGTAQHTKTLDRTAEYAGAVLDAQNDSTCTSATNGTMTSGYDGTNGMSYYDWVSGASAQCYDVVVRITLPSDFNGWSSGTPLTLKTYTNNNTTGLLNVDLRDTTNTSVAGCAYASATPGSNSTWTVAGSSCSFSGGTYTAGGVITVRIRMTANPTDDVRIGDLSLSYKSKF